jgi:hypothetical protein
MITQLLTFMIMAYGFTNILVYGSIFNGPRNFIREKSLDEGSLIHNQWKFLIDMLSCMMCCSTWVGFFLGITIFSPTNQFFGTTPYFSWFFDGLFASGAVWAINGIIEWFEENRPSKQN